MRHVSLRDGIRILLSLWLAAPLCAHADLAFVQVVQGQTRKGSDGIFGKSWVEIKGERMRIVSGYARKVRAGRKDKDPRRFIQIYDLTKKERSLLYPERKAFAHAPLSEVDYGNRLKEDLAQGIPNGRVVSREITLKDEKRSRRLLGTDCAHYSLLVRMTLEGPGNRRVRARMRQNVWVAPVTGNLSKNILDLITFENAYRKRTGSLLTPLDHERYQIREAAAYLRVADWDLRRIVESVRERFRELPSYPIASSVSWMRVDAVDTHAAMSPVKKSSPPVAPARTPQRRLLSRNYPRIQRMPFQALNWKKSERRINRMYAQTRKHIYGAPPSEPSVYPQFEQKLQEVLQLLIEEQGEDFQFADDPQKEDMPAPSQNSDAPFYEIYTQLHGLDTAAKLTDKNFLIPKGFKKVPYE